jgi:hypothetical protein
LVEDINRDEYEVIERTDRLGRLDSKETKDGM